MLVNNCAVFLLGRLFCFASMLILYLWKKEKRINKQKQKLKYKKTLV